MLALSFKKWKTSLPTAIGTDVRKFGNLSKVNCKFSTLVFIFTEFVYVGDAGIIEPSGKTRHGG
jgi:hypothetical protein